jgi:prevent-host-death family protein
MTGTNEMRAARRVAGRFAPVVLQLCVMSARRETTRVGIRELRQNLSVYVRRVREEGQAYEVTERGEPVARLLPLATSGSRVERMMAEGRIAPAARHASELPPALPDRAAKRLSEILDDLRSEDER